MTLTDKSHAGTVAPTDLTSMVHIKMLSFFAQLVKSLLDTAPGRMQQYCYGDLSCQIMFMSENFTIENCYVHYIFKQHKVKMIASRVEGRLAQGAEIC